MRLRVTRPEMRFVRAYKKKSPTDYDLFWARTVPSEQIYAPGAGGFGYFRVGVVNSPECDSGFYKIFCFCVHFGTEDVIVRRRKRPGAALETLLKYAMQLIISHYDTLFEDHMLYSAYTAEDLEEMYVGTEEINL